MSDEGLRVAVVLLVLACVLTVTFVLLMEARGGVGGVVLFRHRRLSDGVGIWAFRFL